MPRMRQQRDAPQAQLTHAAGEAMQILDVAADDQHEAAGDRQGHADGEARDRAGSFLRRPRIVEDAAAGGAAELRRHPVEVARDLAAGGIDQQIETGAGFAGPPRDHGGKALGAARLELLAQADDLGFQRLDDFVGEEVVGAPGDEAHDQGCRRHERAHVDERQTERRRAEQPSEVVQKFPHRLRPGRSGNF